MPITAAMPVSYWLGFSPRRSGGLRRGLLPAIRWRSIICAPIPSHGPRDHNPRQAGPQPPTTLRFSMLSPGRRSSPEDNYSYTNTERQPEMSNEDKQRPESGIYHYPEYSKFNAVSQYPYQRSKDRPPPWIRTPRYNPCCLRESDWIDLSGRSYKVDTRAGSLTTFYYHRSPDGIALPFPPGTHGFFYWTQTDPNAPRVTAELRFRITPPDSHRSPHAFDAGRDLAAYGSGGLVPWRVSVFGLLADRRYDFALDQLLCERLLSEADVERYTGLLLKNKVRPPTPWEPVGGLYRHLFVYDFRNTRRFRRWVVYRDTLTPVDIHLMVRRGDPQAPVSGFAVCSIERNKVADGYAVRCHRIVNQLVYPEDFGKSGEPTPGPSEGNSMTSGSGAENVDPTLDTPRKRPRLTILEGEVMTLNGKPVLLRENKQPPRPAAVT
ncbi:hypothetical protein C8Q77DRAFT_1101093 [Trametes polyzona]|nr:hypothetical protein C8Q77DRAFT_1101093 [Trametes polyzona]